ncbi:MAG: hypothetical protein JSU74_04445, partial [Candidatus Zixiibacteriota bacterium]
MVSRSVTLEEQFSKLKSALKRNPVVDFRLLRMMSFWPFLKPLLNNRTFDSYIGEFTELVINHCQPEHLVDLRVEELESVFAMLSSLEAASARLSMSDDVASAGRAVGVEQAVRLFYIGEAESGLKVLETVFNGTKQLQRTAVELPSGLNELDTLRLLTEKRGMADDPVTRRLESILRDWEILRDETSHSQLECLFVEEHHNQPDSRGRLRALRAMAQYSSAAADSHEVTFEHQLKSPDDPLVGSIYHALSAVQRLLSEPEFRIRRGDFIHAHFRILPSDHSFTGDSIGLGAALVTLVQMLSGQVLRYKRGIATGAAFTGSIDSEGNIPPVNEDTLQHKVERAFCSHVKYLVLPHGNLEAAQDHLAPLKQKYPRRRLTLVGVDRLEEIIHDHNIVRSEKVCAGQYVIRKAHTYSRLTYIQLPLLAILIYVLVCLLYPKAWLGF